MSLSPLLLAAALASPAPRAPSPKDEGFRFVHPAELSSLLGAPGRVFLFDANHPEFRAQNGVIEGATLLSSSSAYDVVSTLPRDRGARLVFYCAGKL